MSIFRLRALGTVALSSMMLAGCGGDGGGSVASAGSTPPPAPPPAGANANLLGTLKSETFANNASQASLSVLGNTVSGTAGTTTASFVYDATSQSYTVTAGGKSQTFAPSAINAAQSNSAVTLYETTSGNTTTGLTLTKPGTSGRFTYEYVGGAFLETANQYSSTSADGSLYAIAYGEPTLASAVPTSGRANYTIDLVGEQATGGPTAPTGITGSGGIAVDFATGNILLGGNLDSTTPNVTGAAFSGTANLSSNKTFSGQFGFYGRTASGQMTGGFYGPAAQEVGAAFSWTDTANSSFDAAGVILGRQTTSDSGVPTMVPALRLRQTATATGIATSYGTAEVGSSSGGNFAFMPDYTAQQVIFTSPSIGSALANSAGTAGFTYLSTAGGAGAAFAYNATGSTPIYDLLLTNPTTPFQALPTTGYAQYNVTLDAVAQKAGSPASEVTGTGIIEARFTSGDISTNGTLNTASPASWTGTAALSSSTGQFSGTIGTTGAVSSTGTWQGAFYGSNGDGVGALFTLAGTDGTNTAGVITGSQNGVTIDPTTTLQNLTSATTFATIEGGYQSISVSFPGTSLPTAPTVTFDPASNTYTVIGSTNGNPAPGFTATLSPANTDPANSDATFTAYSGPNYTAKVLNPGASNPTIQLTYTSFALATETASPSNGITPPPAYHYYVFGLATNASQMPTTGTGTYAGLVYGNGGTIATNGHPASDFSISGTGTLTADFALGSINAAFNLTQNAAGGTPAASLGTYAFGARLTGATFSGSGSGSIISGSFFGPTASEVGATWYVQNVTDNAFSGMGGVFVGKKH